MNNIIYNIYNIIPYLRLYIGSMSVGPRALDVHQTPANTGLCLFNEHSHYVILFKNDSKFSSA